MRYSASGISCILSVKCSTSGIPCSMAQCTLEGTLLIVAYKLCMMQGETKTGSVKCFLKAHAETFQTPISTTALALRVAPLLGDMRSCPNLLLVSSSALIRLKDENSSSL